jgi:hypothetical protein
MTESCGFTPLDCLQLDRQGVLKHFVSLAGRFALAAHHRLHFSVHVDVFHAIQARAASRRFPECLNAGGRLDEPAQSSSSESG